MSAFLCSDRTTVAVAVGMVTFGLATDVVGCAQSLRDANNRALAARYGDPAQPLESIAALITPARNAREINTLARCLRYQCAEGDVLETHPTMPALLALIEATGGESVDTLQWIWNEA